MNKSLEAICRGYIVFNVNGQTFWRFNSALAARQAEHGEVVFTGYNLLKGWRTFFIRLGLVIPIKSTLSEALEDIDFLRRS